MRLLEDLALGALKLTVAAVVAFAVLSVVAAVVYGCWQIWQAIL